MVIALGAGYAETCKSGSGGGSAETADESQYSAAVPTSQFKLRFLLLIHYIKVLFLGAKEVYSSPGEVFLYQKVEAK